MFSIELQQIGSSLTIKLVDVAFLIVVSEVDDRHNAGIPENFFEATLFYLSVSKGSRQKRFSGFCPLRGGGYPPFPLT